MDKKQKIKAIKEILEQKPRETITYISRKLNIPVSIVFDCIKDIESKYILKAVWIKKSLFVGWCK